MPEAQQKNRATMRQVAAAAGVSLKTVSRVMNKVATVDPDLVDRVEAAAGTLGYRHNVTASVIARADGRSRSVGLILEDIANPFSAAVLRAVQDVAWSRRTLVLTGSFDDDPARERHLARTLIDRRVDGLLVVPCGDNQGYLVAEQRLGLPLVFLDRAPRFINADSVVTANRAGAAAAVRHLLAHGHRRIGYLGDRETVSTARERWSGYERALTSAGLPTDPRIVRHGLQSSEVAARAAAEMMCGEQPPTAIFASQNLVTVGVIQALARLGLQHRTALVGFDDFSLADVLRPAVTTVAQQPARIGEMAAEILFRRLEGDTSEPQQHVVDTKLIVRGSGEIPA